MAVKVKVCGITTLADAEKSLEFGADMLGFNFYAPSPRSLTPEKAREIIAQLPAASFNVALFVNDARERVSAVIAGGHLTNGRQAYRGLQFHGEESAAYCRGWGMKVIKAFRLKEKSSLAGMSDFPADFYLFDSWSAGYGGSGAPFPWEWIDGVDASKLILSGGLGGPLFERLDVIAHHRCRHVEAWNRVRVLRIMANSKNLSLPPRVPDRRGHFGPYGGRYVAET